MSPMTSVKRLDAKGERLRARPTFFPDLDELRWVKDFIFCLTLGRTMFGRRNRNLGRFSQIQLPGQSAG
jgi:hypothetical protein